MSEFTDIAIIGAGHAGIEAALAAARTGMDTVLFTMSLESIANMPCNPSIGGTGKGHLVYEIDALGGEMGRAADKVTLQSRTLNLGKGAAVHSKRIQADRKEYHKIMKHTLETTDNLRLIQAEIVDIEVENALLKRALGYEYDEVTVEQSEDGFKRRVTTKQVLPDTTAQIFWLKNRRPDKWRDKPEAPTESNSNESMTSLAELINNPQPNRSITDFEDNGNE